MDLNDPLIVAAHPDDEVIGLGGLMSDLGRPVFVHVTDGAPRDLRDAHRAGCETREEYARLRRSELAAALALAGIAPQQMHPIGLIDQEASFHLPELARQLAGLFEQIRPQVVITHPYEGGHPDHDATAFAVHAACALVLEPPRILEFTSYHARNASFEAGTWLASAPGEAVFALSDAALHLKRRMLACFASQLATLQQFPIAIERLRPAPAYDFREPPHPGGLYYENFDWGVTGPCWRRLAVQALEQLGLEGRR